MRERTRLKLLNCIRLPLERPTLFIDVGGGERQIERTRERERETILTERSRLSSLRDYDYDYAAADEERREKREETTGREY